MEMMLSSLGNDIRNFRIEAGLSQEQLSTLCGMDRAQLSKIEKGTVIGVTFNTIAKIYDALGMKLVGNVVINRVVYNCKPFKHIDTIYKAVMQKKQFEGVETQLFVSKATGKERELALSCIKYWRGHPATKALYFQNPGKGKNCRLNF